MYTFFIYMLLIFIGGIVGWVLACSTYEIEKPFVKRRPSSEEVLMVLKTIRSDFRCTPYEKECIDEACELYESIVNEEENDDR